MSKRMRRFVVAFGLSTVIYLVLCLVVACALTWPRNRDFEDRKEIGGHPVEPISLASLDGVPISAWLIPGGNAQGVVLASGIGSDRLALVRRGEFYAARGFTVILPDLRGTGKSARATVTIGWEERKDIMACVNHLRARGVQRVGVDGISLGASAIAYSFNDAPKYDFVVLESCYDTLDHAWRNRLALFHVPHAITWPIRWFSEARIGQPTEKMAPVRYLDRCTAPTLVVAGDDEFELKLEETQSIFAALGATDKQLHVFKGGHHEDFLRRYEDEFKTTLGSFLDEVSAKWVVAAN